MKIARVCLICSLVLNAILFGHRVFSPTRTPPSEKPSPLAAESPPPQTLSPPTDPRRFAIDLLATDLPARLVRTLVAAELDESFRPREQALLPPPKKLAHWWQTDNTPVPISTRLAQLALRREKSRLRYELLGPDPEAAVDDSTLPPDRRERARSIDEDYASILGDIRGHSDVTRLFTVEERKQIQWIEAEKKRELAEVLQPEELADYEKRTLPIVGEIRRLHGFSATEDEFLEVFAFYQRFSAASKTGINSAVERQIGEPLRAALGDSRYAEFERARNYEFRELRVWVRRANLPIGTDAEVFALRARLDTESHRIGEDTALPIPEKIAALRLLAGTTRDQIRGKLGPDASIAYLKRAESWLSAVEHGDIVTFSTDGWGSRSVALPSPPRPAPAPVKP